MITIKTNIGEVVGRNIEKIISINNDSIIKPVAIMMVGIIRKRVHEDGIASDGGQIGKYSDAYMRVRTGLYNYSKVVKAGKTAGKLKSAGVFSKGKNKGSERPKFNRGTDRKVILSLTRQMENDMTIIATKKGYGIGYTNQQNFDKSQWVEKNYNKSIWNLTNSEKEQVSSIVNQLVRDALS